MIISARRLFRAGALTAVAAVLLVGLVPAAQADIIYNNLGSSQDGSDPIFGVGPLGQSFTTGSEAEALGDVQLLLTSGSMAYLGSFDVSLLADNGSTPGTMLVSLGHLADSAVSTISTGIYQFTPLLTTILAANTTYWIELSASTPNAIEWSYSFDMSALGVANQYAFSSEYGVNAVSGYGAYQLEVGVPEPMTIVVFAGGVVGLVLMRRHRAA